MADFILFGTEGCHLCEQAEQLLLDMDLAFEKRDVLGNEQWMQLYGVRIPVLSHPISGSELAGPFSIERLGEFIARTPVRKV